MIYNGGKHMLLADIVASMRPKHWVKNVFIFFPLLFSGKMGDFVLLVNCLTAFLGLSLMASGVYILNDWFDADSDRFHPRKANRAKTIARLRPSLASVLIVLLSLCGLAILHVVGQQVFELGLVYILLHFVYNIFAKRMIFLDVFFVALGFQIRIWVGSIVSGVIPSVWLQMCVFLLALFLGFAKRRHEMVVLKEKATYHRAVLAHYTSPLLNQLITISSTLIIVFYGLYTISDELTRRTGNHYMIYSLIFVIYGIFRYLYLVYVRKSGDDAGQLLFSDLPFMIDVILWAWFCSMIIYG